MFHGGGQRAAGGSSVVLEGLPPSGGGVFRAGGGLQRDALGSEGAMPAPTQASRWEMLGPGILLREFSALERRLSKR